MAVNAPAAVTTGMELLNIHPSASKPSLISSFWSLHVQLPNQDTSDADLRCSSQTSLPDVVVPDQLTPIDGNKNRMSKSLTDINNSTVDPTLFNRENELPSARSQEDSAEKQRRISFSVQEWLKSIDEPAVEMSNA